MKTPFLLVLMVVATAIAPGIGAAQSTPENGTESGPGVSISVDTGGENSTATPPAREAIDNLTSIESARLVEDRMILVFNSKIPQRVVLTDAGAVFSGGDVPQKSVFLDQGRNRVEMPVTEVQGRVAVTISTRSTLYSKVLDTGGSLISGPYNREDVQTGTLAGLVAGLGVTGVIAYRRVKGVTDAPERVL
jgi:hypothetical protein